jgi:hypothetical protein
MARYTINWGGIDYPVPEQGFFEVTEQIEDHISVPRLLEMTATGNINFARLARPVHILLTHCGVPNPPSLTELRETLLAEGMDRVVAMSEGRDATGGIGMAVVEVITKILMGDAPLKMQQAEAGKKTKPHSSKAATKSRVGSGASRRKTSGK